MDGLIGFYAVYLYVLAVAVIIFLIYKSIVIVGGTELAVLERKYFGRKMPQGRVIAMGDEVGVQAGTLGPGMHFLIPFLYTARKHPFTSIGEDEIGLIESIDGNPVPPGKIFAKVVEGHNSFQDGEAFLANSGEKGPQIQILPPGSYRINPVLFNVIIDESVIIDKGKVGLVTSMDGKPIPSGRLLASHLDGHANFEDGQAFLNNGGQKGPQIDILLPGTYRINKSLFRVEIVEATVIPANKVGLVTALDGAVLPEGEYVSTSVTGHNDYQNASMFLDAGGQRGPQFDVLRPGTYYINPMMFKVELDDVAVIERGQVGVVVSNVGREPSSVRAAVEEKGETEKVADAAAANIDGRLDKGLERYVVTKGFRGIQQEVVGPGRYYLNRRAYIAYIIDTTNITIDWENSKETRFDTLKVISKDGFPIDVSVKVVVRIRPDQAPYMVAKIGSIDNLILHVIHPMIDSSFRNQASSTSAMNFMQDRQEEQKKAEDRTKMELDKYHVECVSVLICQINLPQELMDTQTKKIIAEQQRAMFEAEQQAEQTRIATEKTRAEANQQSALVAAEIGVKVAEQNKQQAIKFAEGEGESLRLKAQGEAAGIKAKGDAEASRILAIGKSTAEAYELQNKAIGQQGVTAIEIAKQIASGKVKITPDLLVQGGDNMGGLMSAFMSQLITGGVSAPVKKPAPAVVPGVESPAVN